MTHAIVYPEVAQELSTASDQTPETTNQTEADSEKQAHDELGLVQRKTAIATKAATGEMLNQIVETKNVFDFSKELWPEQSKELLRVLKDRFEENMNGHKGLWAKVQAKLKANPEKLWSLNEMERTGGEPDVVCFDIETGEFVFMDCSRESPIGRRNLVYDQQAADIRMSIYDIEERFGNAVDMSASMGINLLTSKEYKLVGTICRDRFRNGYFETRSASWLKSTPDVSGNVLLGIEGIVSSTCAINHRKDIGFRGSLKV